MTDFRQDWAEEIRGLLDEVLMLGFKTPGGILGRVALLAAEFDDGTLCDSRGNTGFAWSKDKNRNLDAAIGTTIGSIMLGGGTTHKPYVALKSAIEKIVQEHTSGEESLTGHIRPRGTKFQARFPVQQASGFRKQTERTFDTYLEALDWLYVQNHPEEPAAQEFSAKISPPPAFTFKGMDLVSAYLSGDEHTILKMAEEIEGVKGE